MTSGGNNFNDFRESVPTTGITTKTGKIFLFLARGPAVGLFLEWG